MKARHRIFVLAIFMACFLLPGLAGQGQERTGVCPKPFIKFIAPRASRPGGLVIIRGERFGMPRGKVIFDNKNKLEGFFLGGEAKAEIVNWTFHRIWVLVPKSASPASEVFVSNSCGAESNRVNFTVNK